MQTTERRIKKLKVSSDSKSTLASDLQRIQDAFNIASLPGLPPNGILLIRRLNLGSLAANSSAINLANTIDREIEAIRNQAICIDQQDAPNHPVVWFSDSLHAVNRLIENTLNHRQTAWYWPVLFPKWNQSMDLTQVLNMLSQYFLSQDNRAHTMSQVMELLISSANKQTQFLDAITSQLATSQLAESGLYPRMVELDVQNIENPNLSLTTIKFSQPWHQLIIRAVKQWGPMDVRTHWVMFSAIIRHNPAMMLQTRLETEIQQAVHSYYRHHESSDQHAITDTKNVEIDPNSCHGALPEITELVENTDQPQHSSPLISCPKNEEKLNPSSDNTFDKSNSESAQAELNKPIHNSEKDFYPTQFQGLYSCHDSGLFFLISAMQLLSVETFMTDNDEMAQNNLALRVLYAVARRFEIDQIDKILPQLLSLPVLNHPPIHQFVCPESWLKYISRFSRNNKKLYLVPVKDNINQCLITDSSCKLLLYLGDMNDKSLLQRFKDYDLVTLLETDYSPQVDDLEKTLQFLISRYLYRSAGMGLRQLIHRTAQLSITATHLDVMFDFNQIDIGIRKLGLDINPGWVSWLGKVVQFHYVEGANSHV